MPYMRVKREQLWYVFKKGADGQPVGNARNKKGYDTEAEALPLMRALYAAESRKSQSVAELDLTVLSPSALGIDPVLSQESVHYTEQSTNPDETCAKCAFWSGTNYCYLVDNQPLTIVAEGWCDHFTAAEMTVDEGGIAEMDSVTVGVITTGSTISHTWADVGVPQREAFEDTVIAEFRGTFPQIPYAPGVNKKELLAGDSNPTFVTRPIAQIGKTSKNGILYDNELVKSILEQIIQKKPGALFGHLKSDDRQTQFPIPEAIWVGAAMVGDTLWGKAYVRDRAAAEYINHLKAVNGSIGTSIYGTGKAVDGADGATLLRDFVLETLDFAPPERASLDMGNEMMVTAEMTQDEQDASDDSAAEEDAEHQADVSDPAVGETTMDENAMMEAVATRLKGLAPDAIGEQLSTMLGDDLCGKVTEQWATKRGKKVVAAELETVEKTVITEMQKNTVKVAELQAQVGVFQKQAFESELSAAVVAATPYTAPVGDTAKAAALAETRDVLTLKARLALGDSLDQAQIAETVKTVVTDSPNIMEMLRDRMMGSSAIVGGKDNRTNTRKGLYDLNDMFDKDKTSAAQALTGIR